VAITTLDSPLISPQPVFERLSQNLLLLLGGSPPWECCLCHLNQLLEAANSKCDSLFLWLRALDGAAQAQQNPHASGSDAKKCLLDRNAHLPSLPALSPHLGQARA